MDFSLKCAYFAASLQHWLCSDHEDRLTNTGGWFDLDAILVFVRICGRWGFSTVFGAISPSSMLKTTAASYVFSPGRRV